MTVTREPDPTPDAGSAPTGLLAEIRDAISLRTVGLVLGVLFVQLAFVFSYVGAFHHPTPHQIPVAVVAPAQAEQLAMKLNGLPGEPLSAMALADRATAEQQLKAGTISAVLVVDVNGTQDTLLVASGAGASVAPAVQQVISTVEAAQQRTVTVTDLVPLQTGDGRGLTGFYLVIGWIVGGYLMAALLGVAKGARPANHRRALVRLMAALLYAVISGLGGALVVDQLLGALTGHFFALWGIGTLLVFTAAAVTMALQVAAGVLGIGLTVLLFVVLGNPTAGGAYQASLLPGFWRVLSPALPNGAGTDAVRGVVYLGGTGVTGSLLVIAVYAVFGTVVALVGSNLFARRAARTAG